MWKKEKGGGKEGIVDSARRWLYVIDAVGLTTGCNIKRRIVQICSLWDSLYWDAGDVPDVARTKYSCGARVAF